ncbi:immunity protein Imm33 domain-containing protein [Paraburkholderia megapolitana]|uniref:Imm33-like domain-containing protein n=1 Tax=Paraburkholderia megapolitana TaxID=420953 RepID=A0A1I3IZ63_9BURK|nr:hypothetical protein FNZ07_28540 [Paraburkholderia megapolitana]SFI53282.1 hypothetical protein SAMN05192543_103486 [Paraburkholderia megapolitana]
MISADSKDKQQETCSRFGASYVTCDLSLKVGISRNIKDGVWPLNGLRIGPESDTCGWYIWAGEKFSGESDFFVPLHASHLQEWVSLVLPYLGLPPGWGFLITEQYEDVWEDPQLLKPE